eukprot:4597573-Alexandrium_andersonii.AAC.1
MAKWQSGRHGVTRTRKRKRSTGTSAGTSADAYWQQQCDRAGKQAKTDLTDGRMGCGMCCARVCACVLGALRARVRA